jgi:hypothetical protein
MGSMSRNRVPFTARSALNVQALRIISIVYLEMPYVVLSLNYLQRIKHLLNCIKQEIRELELAEYDLGKSSVLDRQIQHLENLHESLQDISKNPKNYLVF